MTAREAHRIASMQGAEAENACISRGAASHALAGVEVPTKTAGARRAGRLGSATGQALRFGTLWERSGGLREGFSAAGETLRALAALLPEKFPFKMAMLAEGLYRELLQSEEVYCDLVGADLAQQQARDEALAAVALRQTLCTMTEFGGQMVYIKRGDVVQDGPLRDVLAAQLQTEGYLLEGPNQARNARRIAARQLLRVASTLGVDQIYIHKADGLRVTATHGQILAEFSGNNHRALALKHRLSVARIRQIVGGAARPASAKQGAPPVHPTAEPAPFPDPFNRQQK